MKRYYLLLFLLLIICCSKNIKAQDEYHPLIDSTRVWNTFGLSLNNNFQYYVSNTITLNDTIYHKLFLRTLGANEGELLGYIREDSTKQVFFINIDFYPMYGEKLLYDFALKTKDSINFMNFHEGYYAWAIVDTIKTIELDNGSQRKLWEFKYSGMQHPYVIGQWVEGIGSISTELLIPAFVHSSTNETYLLCCFENDELVYKREGYDSCEILPPFIEENLSFNNLVYPNPAKNKVFVNIDGVCSIKIYNVYGTLLVERCINGPSYIDISQLLSGILIIKVNMENNEIVIFKILKT